MKHLPSVVHRAAATVRSKAPKIHIDPKKVRAAMNVWSVTALGIGSMVGAGIFALLGQATIAAGRDVFFSFLAGGIIALLAGYSFAKLSARFPGPGGLIDFLAEAFPEGLFAGTMSLVYYVTLIVTVAVVGKSFGAYAAQLIFGDSAGSQMASGLAVVMVLAIAYLNLVGSGAVGRAEILLVVIKLGILVLLIAASLPSFNSEFIAEGPDVGWSQLMSSVGLTFFAYAGFGMMANASSSVDNPEKVMPRAIFLAITVVIVLYLALALVVLGNLTEPQIRHYADTVVAAAAVPVLGQIGYTVVAIGGLLATISATNATMFSIQNLNLDLAEKGKLPKRFAKPLLHIPFGFLLSVLASIALILSFELTSIAALAGITFLLAYLSVFAAHWRLRKAAGGWRIVIILGSLTMAAVMVGSAIHLGYQQPKALALIAAMLASCFATQWWIARNAPGPKSA